MTETEILSKFKDFTCKRCNQENHVKPRLRDDGPHYAEYRCAGCDCHESFTPKPSERKSPNRTGRHAELVKRFGRGYCEMCLNSADELRKTDTLEGHHVNEFAEAGTEPDSSRENVWILCTACHKLVHYMRTYFGKDRR